MMNRCVKENLTHGCNGFVRSRKILAILKPTDTTVPLVLALFALENFRFLFLPDYNMFISFQIFGDFKPREWTYE